MADDLNDSLDDLLSAPVGDVRTAAIRAPADYQPRDFSEPCSKCRGTGRFTSWSGRSSGQCFACKGAGKFTFKTSPEARAAKRTATATRKERIETESFEAFKAEHRTECEWLVATAPRFEFAASLLASVHKYGSLTENQMAAVRRQIEREVEKAQERAARADAAPAVETAGIDRLKLAFDTAIAKAQAKGRGLKMPRITIGGVVISPAKATSKNPGALYVKESGQYLGKIQGGRFFSARECSQDQEKRVLAFVADPKAAAIAYGLETGVCCICNAELTNKVSIERGIGPICAENFGW